MPPAPEIKLSDGGSFPLPWAIINATPAKILNSVSPAFAGIERPVSPPKSMRFSIRYSPATVLFCGKRMAQFEFKDKGLGAFTEDGSYRELWEISTLRIFFQS
jgi:hypothetical protein